MADPSSRRGRHLGPNFIMTRLRNLSINLLAARNTALQSLVVEAPPPPVAELLGYSYNTTQRHAEIAAQPWARYVTKTATESNRPGILSNLCCKGFRPSRPHTSKRDGVSAK